MPAGDGVIEQDLRNRGEEKSAHASGVVPQLVRTASLGRCDRMFGGSRIATEQH
jgi:hypothetical protein